MIIEKLNKLHNRTNFDCGYESLNRYLKELSFQHQNKDIGVTYVLFESDCDNTILGYYTLISSSVNSNIFPVSHPKHYEVPSLLIGRLAVDKSMHGKHVGEFVLFNALSKAIDSANSIGIRIVVVDAIDISVKSFYERYGFKELSDDPLHLYITVKELRAMFARINLASNPK